MLRVRIPMTNGNITPTDFGGLVRRCRHVRVLDISLSKWLNLPFGNVPARVK